MSPIQLRKPHNRDIKFNHKVQGFLERYEWCEQLEDKLCYMSHHPF